MSGIGLNRTNKSIFSSASAFNAQPQGRLNNIPAAVAQPLLPADEGAAVRQQQELQQRRAIAAANKAQQQQQSGATKSIVVNESFQWNAKTDVSSATGASVLKKQPLIETVQREGLSTDEQFNIEGMYLKRAHNATPSVIGLVASGVNGKTLDHEHQAGIKDKVAFTLMPGQTVDYSHLNDGKGLELHKNQLDHFGAINVQLSPADLKKFVIKDDEYLDPTTGKYTHSLVKVDLSGFTNPDLTGDEKFAVMNPLARIVYSNARPFFVDYPRMYEDYGIRLPPLSSEEYDDDRYIDNIRIVHDSRSNNPSQFIAIIDADELEESATHYGSQIKEKAQPTNANSHSLVIVRPNRRAGDKFGDYRYEPGVTASQLTEWEGALSGVHFTLHYDINHNGKPHVEASKTATKL